MRPPAVPPAARGSSPPLATRPCSPGFVWADGPLSSAQTPRHLRVSAGISARLATRRCRRGQRETPVYAGLLARFRMAGPFGRPTTENRGVPGSNPGLAMAVFACSKACFSIVEAASGAAKSAIFGFLAQSPSQCEGG